MIYLFFYVAKVIMCSQANSTLTEILESRVSSNKWL